MPAGEASATTLSPVEEPGLTPRRHDRSLPWALAFEHAIRAILGPETAGIVLPDLRSLVRRSRRSRGRRPVDPDASRVATAAAALVDTCARTLVEEVQQH